MSHHPLYRVWVDMMARCGHTPCYSDRHLANYHDRGITVCDEWRNDRAAFFDWALANGWRQGLQIDREKNHLGYFPDNCRFVTCTVNNRNRLQTRLTEEKVMEIKQLLVEHIHPIDIGARFGVHEATIRNIKAGRTWKEV